MAPNERFETYGSTPEIRESRSDDILRHPLMRRNMSVVPATARSERARGVLGGGGDRPPPKSVWADAHGLEFKASLGGEPKVLTLFLDKPNRHSKRIGRPNQNPTVTVIKRNFPDP